MVLPLHINQSLGDACSKRGRIESTMRRFRVKKGWDLGAVALSFVCMLHCIGLPLLTSVLPVTSFFADSHLFHIVMVAMALPITLLIVIVEWLGQRREFFIAGALLGLSLLVIAVAVPALEFFEVALTVAGAALLSVSHLWRWMQQRTEMMPTNDDV